MNGSAIKLNYDDDGLTTQVGDLRLFRNKETALLIGTRLGEITDTFHYNGFGEVTSYRAAFKDSVIFATEYNRDKLGRLIEKRETIAGTSETFVYVYDAAGRLAEVRNAGATRARYTYDDHGNRMGGPTALVTYVYDAENQLLERNSGAEEPKGTNIRPAAIYGRKRQAAPPPSTTMTSLAICARSPCRDRTRIEYIIDGLNRRVGKKVNGVLVQSFLYFDDSAPVAELDGSDRLVSRFVYGTRSNVPDYLIRDGVTYRIISDHLGSPRLVVNVISGAIAQRLDYDEFGNVISASDPGFQPFGFAGGLYDAASGLLRFGMRDYAPALGRWTAKDPVLFAGNDTNLYVYALNDPVNLVDLDGRAPSDGIKADDGLDFLKALYEGHYEVYVGGHAPSNGNTLDNLKALCEGFKKKLAQHKGERDELQAKLQNVEQRLKLCLTAKDRRLYKNWQRGLSHRIKVLSKTMQGEYAIVSSRECKNFEIAYGPLNRFWEDVQNQAGKAWEDAHRWADIRRIIKFPY